MEFSAPRPRRLIVGISGASGIGYGIRALQILRELGIETHLVMTRAAEMTLVYESPLRIEEVRALATVYHPIGDIGATIASGSFRTQGMVIAPCSVKTLSEIASGACQTLLTRSADVCLKERRRLVLMVRETPLHLGHLRSMVAVTEMGGIIMPPVPAFYAAPARLEDVIDHSVSRALELLGIETEGHAEWQPPRGANRLDLQPKIASESKD
ncbi:MAG: UbiX family flavin prenyltransferase [Alphaproteobacteria bacterium]|nr:UbiX family flavin prenyltransferase [Alphaproteobacteria bacterium]